MPVPPASSPSPRAARVATAVVFFVNGLLFATWGVNVPNFKALHALSDATVSLALLAASFGALVGVLRAGALVERFGARAVSVAGVVASAVAIGALLRLPDVVAGAVALFVFGVGSSSADVAINAHTVDVEAALGRPIMSSSHGFFSIGGLVGAALGSVLAAAGVAPRLHMAAVGMAACALTALAVPRMLVERHAATSSTERSPRRFGLAPPAVLLLGTMAVLAFVTEGAMYDWSVLYLRETLGAPQSLAALAYASLSIAMAAGRFGGDAARARWGQARLLRGSGAIAAAGLVGIVVVGEPVAALVGFAVVGLALANVVPVLFAAASTVPGVAPARGIAVVAGMGYLGFLGGPPLIGVVAEHAGLSVAIGGLALFVAALALLARRVP